MDERWSWPQILFAPCQSPLHYKLKINHNMNGFQSLFDLWVFINCGQYLLISVWLLAWNQSKPKVSPTQGIFPTGAWGRCLARPCLGWALFFSTYQSKYHWKQDLERSLAKILWAALQNRVIHDFTGQQTSEIGEWSPMKDCWHFQDRKIQSYNTNSLGSTNLKTVQKKTLFLV